ncbi:MAG: EthD family reductase [Thermaerobacter sp.]|nr:EthD family reductase [Thermaerobacter sp.]
MVQLIALYRRPDDEDAFLRRYREEHLPLARQMPGLQRIEVGPLEGLGDETPYWYMATLSFPDRAVFEESQRAPVSREAAKVLMSFAKGLVDFALREVEE